MISQGTPIEQTDEIRTQLRTAAENVLKITSESSVVRDKGYYGVCLAIPSKALRNALSVDREILILISTFEDQQARTIATAKSVLQEWGARLDPALAIIIHRDPRGSAKLKKWGREQGLAVLPIYAGVALPAGDELLRMLAYELFSFDIFDVTGPVADDAQFYGRREEARELAKKLQSGQIRSCFGIRKIGKTSILHRVVNEVRANYDCTTFLIDAQSDAVFSLTAAQLIASLAVSIEDPARTGTLKFITEQVDLSLASRSLAKAVAAHEHQILLVFDEVDYLTPTSPTASHWKDDFNPFWRNVRAVYQEASIVRKNLSLLISGVSSKWFSQESIGDVENAALAFVPEEYLSPLPRGAATAMIRRLGRTVGLIFSDSIADQIASSCADMPFWIRKACSFLHSRIDVGLRPFEVQAELVRDHLRDFVNSDGIAMSEVALAHLFRVYPELRLPALACVGSSKPNLNARVVRTLERYGIVRRGSEISISGQMMLSGLESLGVEDDVKAAQPAQQTVADGYQEWAEELAIISRRRNVVERKLRGVVANFLRFSSLNDGASSSAKDRVLKCIDANRRSELNRFDLDDIMSKLYWLELIAVLKKEWDLFAKVFGDKAELERCSKLVNERPDAHAKELDMFDVALHRKAIAWFEDRVSRL